MTTATTGSPPRSRRSRRSSTTRATAACSSWSTTRTARTRAISSSRPRWRRRDADQLHGQARPRPDLPVAARAERADAARPAADGAATTQPRTRTAFTVSIEAREGVTTGISAHDRARTIAVAIDPTKGADDIVSPGHVFPLRRRARAACWCAPAIPRPRVDLARLAGLNPAGVICEIMNDDGTMARLPDLVAFAQRHGLKIGTIADLIAYRRRYDNLVNETAARRGPVGSAATGDARLHRRDPGRRAHRADQGRHRRRPSRCWCGCTRSTRSRTCSASAPHGRRPVPARCG